eukprot:5424963-Prymnesium_polylepis.2
MKTCRLRGGVAGSLRHDRSKEVSHGSFAPRTGQIRAELAEIDHARHQRYAGSADARSSSVAHEPYALVLFNMNERANHFLDQLAAQHTHIPSTGHPAHE